MKSIAFTLVSIVCQVYSFAPVLRRNADFPNQKVQRSALFAETGPPQYDKVEAVLQKAEVVGEGSVMLHVETTGENSLDYQPGHVLALEIEAADSESLDEKTAKDAKTNGGWMRGPYTVSRATENSIDVLIKVVGAKSQRFASAEPGTPVKFGGKFHVPIIEGINKADTKRVVFVSTGVGVGPCIGSIEKALEDSSFPPIDLYASFRTSDEIICGDYLDSLATENPATFSWKAIVSSESGRLSSNEKNMRDLLFGSSEELGLSDTHYHLIGNGGMVNEWKAGLAKAGVPDEKVTIETYFNHKDSGNDEVIDRIANVISSPSGVPALD